MAGRIADLRSSTNPRSAPTLGSIDPHNLTDEQKIRRSDIWRALIESRGRRYAGCTFESYQREHDRQTEVADALLAYGKDAQNRLRSGQNILLFGPSGTGKDHLAIATALEVIRYACPSIRWIYGLKLFSERRDYITKDETEEALIRRFTRPHVLIISDPVPPAGELSGDNLAILSKIIDRRYSELRPTWITVNVANRSELESRLSVQLVERLIHDALVLHCNWPSYRKPAKTGA